jgi:hypothetical protein
MKLINCVVERKPGERLESLINRFSKKINDEGVLKDHKLNVLSSREERKQFKLFASKRRTRKKIKRVSHAMKG